jgi:hypothetical protein
MPDYEQLYNTLYRELTEVIGQLERGNVSLARQYLVTLQQEAEEQFLQDSDLPSYAVPLTPELERFYRTLADKCDRSMADVLQTGLLAGMPALFSVHAGGNHGK